ncbi:MAG TPA: PQQ-dependent sugar dehydrogenase [Actinomycetota bacterium]|jgi:glucose/arabinose dehydrogenase|nr:PQQ-dependent sugar dehydrogenase [Actinomycetota bacterium]
MRLRLALGALALVLPLPACGSRSVAPTPPPPASPPVDSPQVPDSSPEGSPSPGVAGKPGPPRLVRIGEFDQPTYVAAPPGDRRLFIVERDGRIVVIADGRAKSAPYLDISNQVSTGSERGLFSIAFAPDYSRSGLAYVSYTDTSGDSRIVEYKVDPSNPDRLDPGSRREILFVEQPYSNHNGGLIAFDPSGMLIIGFGDGGSRGDPGNRAQNLGVLLGKFLRIDPRKPSGGLPYGIPPDNPFVSRSGARPEIWAYGLRNPWRWSFDAAGDLFVADVGQDRIEEINFVPRGAQAGANYGWPRYEGAELYKNQRIDESRLVTPVLTYPLSGSRCSVVGGGVYRGEVESLRGVYIYGDYCEGVVKGFRVQNGRAVNAQTFEDLEVSNLSSFGEDSDGQMYATSLGGAVYRISAGG